VYKKILVALQNGPADETILPHVAELAQRFGPTLLLLRVADGWVARNFNQLELAESEEMKDDRIYLERVASDLRAKKLAVSTLLALGNPAAEILKVAAGENCDLRAMTSHGHRFFGDIFHGSTITQVRHQTTIPSSSPARRKNNVARASGLRYVSCESFGRSTKCSRFPSPSSKNKTLPPPAAGRISSVNFTPRVSNSAFAASIESTRKARWRKPASLLLPRSGNGFSAE
jgi:nucleotide-binding universal stress UspA family protein